MKALVNALTLALLDADQFGSDIAGAREFATQFVTENAELLNALPKTVADSAQQQALVTPNTAVPGEWNQNPDGTFSAVRASGGDRATVMVVQTQGPDGLTPKQRAAVGTIGLCPNCQQPRNDHVPGCSVASGYDVRAVTKTPLPPIS